MNAETTSIRTADPRSPDAMRLLEHHWRYTSSHSPPESVHALDIDGLTMPGVTFWIIEVDGEALGCIALQELDPAHGEIKSMHVLELARGRGLARQLVQYVLNEARQRGYTRLSLETGSMDAFKPARTLYASFGFEPCPPFANYWDDPNSSCMTMAL